VNLNGCTNNVAAPGVGLLKEQMHGPVLHQGNDGNEEFFVAARRAGCFALDAGGRGL
jgi:hypothetical protein